MRVGFSEDTKEKLENLKSGLLSGYQALVPNSDAALQNRFSRPPKIEHNITYEFTRDHNLLEQYFILREEQYRRDFGLDDFYGREDEFDLVSHILIAKNGNTCIGGARLTISSPSSPKILPLESNGLSLQHLFEGINLKRITYCEMSRFALLPEYRNNTISEEIYRLMYKKVEERGIKLGFAIAPALQMRRYKAIFGKFGLAPIIIESIKLPEPHVYHGLDPVFSVVDFSADSVYSDYFRSYNLRTEIMESDAALASVA